MDECFKCGVSGEKVRLKEAISNKGIVKICDNCSSIENLPIIKKPTEIQITESQRYVPIRERYKEMKRPGVSKEVSLRDIIDKNFKDKKTSPPSDLIDNFHWEIQRIKRMKRISRDQFAKAIGESEATVRMIEQGFLPENNYKVINKIESYLEISLRKPGTSGFPETPQEPRKFILDNSLIEGELPKKFNPDESRKIKISDLKEMGKKYQETLKKQEPIDSWEESEDYEEDLDNLDDL